MEFQKNIEKNHRQQKEKLKDRIFTETKKKFNNLEKEIKEGEPFTKEEIEIFLQYNEMLYEEDLQRCRSLFGNELTKDVMVKILSKNSMFDFFYLEKAKKIRKKDFTVTEINTMIQETNMKNLAGIVKIYELYKNRDLSLGFHQILEVIKNFEKISSERIEGLVIIARTKGRTFEELQEYTKNKLQPNTSYNIIGTFQKFFPSEDLDKIIDMVKQTKIEKENTEIMELIDRSFLNNLGIFSLEERLIFINGQKTNQEIFDILKTKERNYREYMAIEKLYKKRMPEIIKMVEEDNLFPVNPKVALLTTYSTIQDKADAANGLYEYLKNMELINEPIKGIIESQYFIKRVKEMEPKSPLTSFFSIAIALKRALPKKYSEQEFKDKLEKILQMRKQFKELNLGGKDTKGLTIAYTVEQREKRVFSITGTDQNNRDYFNPKSYHSLLKKSGSSCLNENERGLEAKRNALKLLEQTNEKLFFTVAGHGIKDENAIDVGDGKVKMDELFEAIKKRALKYKDAKLVMNLFCCYGYDFAQYFLKKWKQDPDLQKEKILPPHIITHANKGGEHLLASNQPYNILNSEKKNGQAFTGKDLIDEVEKINFIGGKGLFSDVMKNDMGFFLATPDFRTENLIEIGGINPSQKFHDKDQINFSLTSS